MRKEPSVTHFPVRRAAFFLPALLLGLTLTARPACAQTPPPPAPPPAQAAPPQAAPALSPAQRARAAARTAQYNKDVKALQANTKLTPAQKEAQFHALQQSANTDLMAILTPAQRAVMQQRQQQAMQQQQEMGAFQQAHKPEIDALMSLRAKLMGSLTPAQHAKIDAISKATQGQMETVHNDPSLSLQAKQDKEHALSRRATAQFLTVLTPAQRAEAKQMDAMRNKLQAAAMAQQGH